MARNRWFCSCFTRGVNCVVLVTLLNSCLGIGLCREERSLVPAGRNRSALVLRQRLDPQQKGPCCSFLLFLSDKTLLHARYGNAPTIWDLDTGQQTRKLTFRGNGNVGELYYAACNGDVLVCCSYRRVKGWQQQLQLWDLAGGTHFALDVPNIEGDAHHLYVTRDMKTLWATSSPNPCSGAFNQLRFRLTTGKSCALDLQHKAKRGEDAVPLYHCATENLLLHFSETSAKDRGVELKIWDLETLATPDSRPRSFMLNGHHPSSFFRTRVTHPADTTRRPYPPYERANVGGVMVDRYTNPDLRSYACLAVPARKELYVLVAFAGEPLGRQEGMRLTVIDLRGSLVEKLCFDLPVFGVENMVRHPTAPLLFCLTRDGRLLAIDTDSRAITETVGLEHEGEFPVHARGRLAIAPNGRLLAADSPCGRVSIFECLGRTE